MIVSLCNAEMVRCHGLLSGCSVLQRLLYFSVKFAMSMVNSRSQELETIHQ